MVSSESHEQFFTQGFCEMGYWFSMEFMIKAIKHIRYTQSVTTESRYGWVIAAVNESNTRMSWRFKFSWCTTIAVFPNSPDIQLKAVMIPFIFLLLFKGFGCSAWLIFTWNMRFLCLFLSFLFFFFFFFNCKCKLCAFLQFLTQHYIKRLYFAAVFWIHFFAYQGGYIYFKNICDLFIFRFLQGTVRAS